MPKSTKTKASKKRQLPASEASPPPAEVPCTYCQKNRLECKAFEGKRCEVCHNKHLTCSLYQRPK